MNDSLLAARWQGAQISLEESSSGFLVALSSHLPVVTAWLDNREALSAL